jgi:FkbM family methyltransferase
MWYRDPDVVRRLPARYRAYALYCRIVGSRSSRRVRGGSFLLRALRNLNHALGLESVARIRGIDGLEVFADFNDERILDVIHEIRGENPEYRVMRELLSPGDTFIDVGANFGTFSLLASRLVGESGRVIAIEPQPRLVELIRRSAIINRFGNLQVVNAACGSAPGTVTLLIPVADSGRAGIFPQFSGNHEHESLSVPVVQLDQIVSSGDTHANVVIKVDVEGSEVAVLDGAQRLIHDALPAILVEINPWSARAAGGAAGSLLLRLQALGYQSFATMTSFPLAVDVRSIDTGTQSNIVARR